MGDRAAFARAKTVQNCPLVVHGENHSNAIRSVQTLKSFHAFKDSQYLPAYVLVR